MKINKAVFPSAGFGTRFLPATKAIPKELLPLVDKPLIQYTMEEAAASGIKEAIIVTSSGKDGLKNHFSAAKELERFLKKKGKRKELKAVKDATNLMHISYARQKEPLGLGHAILCAKKLVGKEPFAVFLGDDIIDAPVPAMKQMLRVFEKYSATVIAVQKVPKSKAHMYGVIKAEPLGRGLHKVVSLVEKPQSPPSNLAIIGRYILTPAIFGALLDTKPGKGGEVQLTDGIKRLLKTEDVYALEFKGERYDAGDKLGFIQANIALGLKRKELKGPLKKFIKNIL